MYNDLKGLFTCIIKKIYKITNIKDNKAIIGQSVHILNRWKCYRSSLRNNHYTNQYLQEAWNRDGEQNFKFEIILECSDQELNQEEKRLIREYKTADVNFGYNIEYGGNLHGIKEETRKKLSEQGKLRKGLFTMLEAQKKKISDAMKGHTVSKETREKLRLRKRTEEQKEKMRNRAFSKDKKVQRSSNNNKTQKRISPLSSSVNERLNSALEWSKLSQEERNNIIQKYT